MKYGATEPLIEENGGEQPNLDTKNEKQTGYTYPFAVASALIGAAATATLIVLTSTNSSSNFFRSSTSFSEDAITVAVSNEYGSYMDNLFSYPFLDDSLLAEPYRETTYTITNAGDSCSYSWELTGTSFSQSGSSTDGVFYATAEGAGSYSLSVSESCDDGTARTLDQDVYVKYIRRELSSLTDDDREDFLDAFRTLWDVNTVDGQALYGDRYKSLYYLATVHNDAGANPVCDEFHGDSGFVNNHMMLSSYLEQSLQLVNPKVALHYMDYSMYFENDDFQNHISNQLDGGAWTEILTEKWFGSNDPATGKIIDGRWANSEQPTMDDEFFEKHGVDQDSVFWPMDGNGWLASADAHMTSPYGLLRSPWNYNRANYTARYNNIHQMANASDISDVIFLYYKGVTCDDYTTFVEEFKGQQLAYFLQHTEDDVHGIIHFTFGGQGGTHANTVVDTLRADYGFTDNYIAVLSLSAQSFFKYYMAITAETMPGGGYPLNCTSDPWQNSVLTTTSDAGEDGGPTCVFTDDYMTDEDSLNELISKFFTIDPDTDYSVVQFLNTFEYDDRKAIMQLLPSFFPFDGEMGGSGAATDPLFWVNHGAVERFFQYASFKGWFSDLTYAQSSDIPCSGHMSTTAFAWLDGFYFLDETVDASSLTNTDLTSVLYPLSDDYSTMINYVYDSSSYSWCDESSWDSAEGGKPRSAAKMKSSRGKSSMQRANTATATAAAKSRGKR